MRGTAWAPDCGCRARDYVVQTGTVPIKGRLEIHFLQTRVGHPNRDIYRPNILLQAKMKAKTVEAKMKAKTVEAKMKAKSISSASPPDENESKNIAI